jgi:hypothetical protein
MGEWDDYGGQRSESRDIRMGADTRDEVFALGNLDGPARPDARACCYA